MVGEDRLHSPSQLQISPIAPRVDGHSGEQPDEKTDRGDFRPFHALSHRRTLPKHTPATPTAARLMSLDRSRRISPEYPLRSPPPKLPPSSGCSTPPEPYLPRRTGNLTAMQGNSLQRHQSRPSDTRRNPLPFPGLGRGRSVFQSGKKPPLSGDFSKSMIHSGQRPPAGSRHWVGGVHSSPSESRQAEVSCGS